MESALVNTGNTCHRPLLHSLLVSQYICWQATRSRYHTAPRKGSQSQGLQRHIQRHRDAHSGPCASEDPSAVSGSVKAWHGHMISTLTCGTLAGVLWSMSSKEGENLLALQRLALV